MTLHLDEIRNEASAMETVNPQRGAYLSRAADKISEGLNILRTLGFLVSDVLNLMGDGALAREVSTGAQAGTVLANSLRAEPFPSSAEVLAANPPPAVGNPPQTGNAPVQEQGDASPHDPVPFPVDPLSPIDSAAGTPGGPTPHLDPDLSPSTKGPGEIPVSPPAPPG